MEITTKFKLGTLVVKKNPHWGESEPFYVGSIHLASQLSGKGSEPHYSPSYYDYGYPESELERADVGVSFMKEYQIAPYKITIGYKIRLYWRRLKQKWKEEK